MIASFRDQWLDDFYFADHPSAKVPGNIESALHRKLTLLHVATAEGDLKCPPGNRFEHLKGKSSNGRQVLRAGSIWTPMCTGER